MARCTDLLTSSNSNEQILLAQTDIFERVRKLYAKIVPYGVYSCKKMRAAGFRYTGNDDTVHCDTCSLEVSEWNQAMNPFTVHAERSPQCPFILSRLPMNHSKLNDQQNPAKRQRTDLNSHECKHNYKLVEVKSLKQIRRRTFAHWSHRMKPSVEQLIDAGFFSCNVGDRVICLYCNLICQQWVGDLDDPAEVHKTLSAGCPYVLSILIHPELSPTLILNDIATNVNNPGSTLNNFDQHRFDQIVYTRPCHELYSNITKRSESFATWTHTSAPPVDELVRAGFFYIGTGTAVTCFYCNGSLQNWGAKDNPIREHARWFGNCPYAKQLCGDELHRTIQEANRAHRNRANQSGQRDENSNPCGSNRCQLEISDSRMLSRLVAARLDLPNSQHLLDQQFKLSIIKRCWEDQLQLKKDDFVSDSDLLTSCTILQKQIDHIQGNKENIVIPSERMRTIREGAQSNLSPPQTTTNNNEKEAPQDQPVSTLESTATTITKEQSDGSETKSSISNPCIICYQDEKRLACIPCGHFTACVPCSHSLRTCPVCRRSIEAFVRIYI